MRHHFVITGTDTGVGKTIFSAALTGALGACYWKPVQSGLDGETDSQCVQRLGRIPPHRILPEAWRLTTPVAPHLSAEMDGVLIDAAGLTPPTTEAPLVIEGAGGLLVPLTRDVLFIDLFARWQFAVILCARTTLGTINHTLLSLEALRRRQIPVLGVAFIGHAEAGAEATIQELGRVRCLGRLPYLDHLTPDALRSAFDNCFDLAAFQEDCDR